MPDVGETLVPRITGRVEATVAVTAFLILAGLLSSCTRDGSKRSGPVAGSEAEQTATTSGSPGNSETLSPMPSAPPVPGADVILIVVDTLRADHLGAYGYARDTSPHIDAFAREALVFRRAYTPRPQTTPAMASLFTGVPPHVHGARDVGQALPADIEYLPERLDRHGYTTLGVVSNAALYREFGFHRGFDTWEQVWDVGTALTDRALARIDDALAAADTEGDRPPIFLWMHYGKPHAPYKPGTAYHRMFVGDALWAEDEVPLSKSRYGAYRRMPAIVDVDGITNPHYYIAEYDAEIRDVDAEIGRLLDGLRARGLYQDSLVVFTSDHGESLGEHDYYFEHGLFPYEMSGRVPLMIRHPRRDPGVTDIPASLLDLVPTVLSTLAVEMPAGATGTNLFGAADRELWERPIFADAGHENEPQVSVRLGRWKLIHVPSERDRQRQAGGAYELYDLQQDPAEENDLAGQGLEIEATLAEMLHGWRASWEHGAAMDATAPEVTGETLEQLRTLGYVD